VTARTVDASTWGARARDETRVATESAGRKRVGAGGVEGEERIETREFEERTQIVVEPHQTQVTADVAETSAERDQRAQPRGGPRS
jgi:hypothetical protein